jgi:hypothetical protein
MRSVRGLALAQLLVLSRRVLGRGLVLSAFLGSSVACSGTLTPTVGERGILTPIETASLIPIPWTPPTAAQLGPWSPKPFDLDPGLVAAVDRACRASLAPFPAGAELVVADARGEGLVQAYFYGPNGAWARCDNVTVAADGGVRAAGGGKSITVPGPLRPLGRFELEIGEYGSSSPPPSSYVYGRAGSGIVRVEIGGPSLPLFEASLANGWFAAWVPAMWPSVWTARGLDANGQVVATSREQHLPT